MPSHEVHGVEWSAGQDSTRAAAFRVGRRVSGRVQIACKMFWHRRAKTLFFCVAQPLLRGPKPVGERIALCDDPLQQIRRVRCNDLHSHAHVSGSPCTSFSILSAIGRRPDLTHRAESFIGAACRSVSEPPCCSNLLATCGKVSMSRRCGCFEAAKLSCVCGAAEVTPLPLLTQTWSECGEMKSRVTDDDSRHRGRPALVPLKFAPLRL